MNFYEQQLQEVLPAFGEQHGKPAKEKVLYAKIDFPDDGYTYYVLEYCPFRDYLFVLTIGQTFREYDFVSLEEFIGDHAPHYEIDHTFEPAALLEVFPDFKEPVANY